MAQPRPTRRGVPRWQDTLLAAVDAKERPTRTSIGLNFTQSWNALVMQAARQRGLSMATYCRRAIMAFVFHDLGLDWRQEMKHEPRIRPMSPPDADPQRCEGYGYGKWKITGLEEYADERDPEP